MTADAKLQIEWDSHDSDSWRGYLLDVARSNLIQTWPYAQAVRRSAQRRTRFGLICLAAEPVGFCQIQELRLPGFHYVGLHRGPLWFDGQDNGYLAALFFEHFAVVYPPRPGRFRRLLPEIAASSANHEMLTRFGLKRQGEGYRTLWLDLTASLEALRAGLHQKWRNRLRQSERQGMRCETRTDKAAFDWLLPRYLADRKAKRYRGPSSAMLSAMADSFSIQNDMLLLRAHLDGDTVAAILLFLHGRAATYQIGWSNSQGRKSAATNFLLWQAIEILKERGIDWFDLGGIHPDAAPGLTHFKSGLGGTAYQTIGAYK